MKSLPLVTGANEPNAANEGELTLISRDKAKIKISKKAAKESGLITDMVEEYDEDEVEVPINNVKASVLKKVVEFCEKHALDKEKNIEKNNSDKVLKIPRPLTVRLDLSVQKWYREYVDAPLDEIAEYLKAANFMDIQPLVDLASAKFASAIMRKPSDMKQTLELLMKMPVDLQRNVLSYIRGVLNLKLWANFKRTPTASELLAVRKMKYKFIPKEKLAGDRKSSAAFAVALRYVPEITELHWRRSARDENATNPFNIFAQEETNFEKVFKYLTKLTTLELYGHLKLKTTGFAAALKHLPQLTKLELTPIRQKDDAVEIAAALKHVPNLAHLNLRYDYFKREAIGTIPGALQHVPQLESLRASGRIGDEGAVAFAKNLKHVPELLSLELDSNDIGVEGAEAVAEATKNLPNLKKLNLNYNKIGVGGAAAVAEALKKLNNLEKLELENNSLKSDGAVKIAAALKYIPKLLALYLGENDVRATGAEAIAKGLVHVPKLRILNLEENLIGDKGAAALAKNLKHVPELLSLELDDNDIGGEGAAAIAEANLPNLKRLILSNNRIGDKGAEAVAAANMPSLRWLNLRDNEIFDRGAEAVAAATKPNLKRLNLSYNQISAAATKRITKIFVEMFGGLPDFELSKFLRLEHTYTR